jgi:dTDP-4-amino-4,6-dideoxygalactose transaminase
LPIPFRDLFAFFNSERHPGSLEEDFFHFLAVDHLRITCSGTAGLYFIAETLKDLSPKRTVVIPAYTCPLVALALARAGLKVLPCDISGNSFDMDTATLERCCAGNTDIAAVVVIHLGGIPADIAAASGIAKKHGVLLIEDCAQALGAEYEGRKVGTFGDFAFFSMAAGKGLTLYEGGAVTAKSASHARLLDAKIATLEKHDSWQETMRIIELCGYAVFYRPSLFWFVYRLPEFFWRLVGQPRKAMLEDFTIDFPVHTVGRFRKFIGHIGFSRLKDAIENQRRKAAIYAQALQSCEGVTLLQELPGTRATYPYVAVRLNDVDPARRQFLERTGMGISVLFSEAITDYADLQPFVIAVECPQARFAASHLVSLSTGSAMRSGDLARAADLVRQQLCPFGTPPKPG